MTSCAFFLLAAALGAEPSAPLSREDFEGPEPTWRLVESDCGASLTEHGRTFDRPRGGKSCEYLQLHCGRGSKVLLQHPVAPACVIEELVPRIWLRSDRGGAQLLARVVLPRTRSLQDGKPLSIAVRGDSYSNIGAWQQLGIADLAAQVRRQEPVLRTRYGGKIDVREAYVDRLMLNAYAGVGAANLWIDELELSGFVASSEGPLSAEIERAGFESPDVPQATGAKAAERIQLHGSVLSVAGRPILVRAIEHRGEAFAWLKELGFNAVTLFDPPTREHLAEARRTGLWLVAPPPHFDGGEPFGAEYDCILAWDLGRGLTKRELAERRRQIEEVRLSDGEMRRPIVLSAESQLSAYSRLADVLRFELAPLGSSFELGEAHFWLRERSRLARPGTPYWAVVQTEPAPAALIQLAAFGLDMRSKWSLEPEQIRLLGLHAVAGGARGLQFASSSRLDGNDIASQTRASTLRLLNQELALLEPWGAGGTFDRELQTSDPQTWASVLQTERSRLAILLRQMPGQQFVCGPPSREPLSLVDSGASSSPQAYLVGGAGVEPIRSRRRDAGGLRLTLEDAAAAAHVVLTQDPLVVNYLARQAAQSRVGIGRLHYDVALRNLAVVEDVDARLAALGKPLAGAPALLAEARGNLKQAQRLATSDDAAALVFATRAQGALARIRRGHWEAAVAGFASPVASPFCLQFETLSAHWQLAERLKSGRWSGNMLSGGEMEDLQQMLRAEWRNEQHAETTLSAGVDLAAAAARSGQFGLRMRASSPGARQNPAVVESPPLRITSGPISLTAGNVARIHGWVRLPGPLAGSRDGLLVYDSLGGKPLAQRITKSGEWQEFVLYRAAPQDGALRLSFELTGAGEAWIDDVTITLLEQ